MKHIRNPDIYWPRLWQLSVKIEKARRNHKKRLHLEREAVAIRTAILACEARQQRA